LRWSRDSNPGYRFQYVSLANWWFKPLTHSTLERKKQAISFNNRVFPEATAKIYAVVINTNEIEEKFQLDATFFLVGAKRFDFQKIENGSFWL